MKLSIDLSLAQADRLRIEAERLGLTPEDLARAAIVDLLAATGQDFKTAADRVLKKEPGVVSTPRLMRYLALAEVVDLHRRLLEATGGAAGIRDLGARESALAQARMTLGGSDVYPTLAEKAAALCFSLVGNHPFVDGNKRVGHAAMETFLVLNDAEIDASLDE